MISFAVSLAGQEDAFSRISFLVGEWNGTGSGFGNQSSMIASVFKTVMNNNYIEVINHSRFAPTESKPEGETHIDHGFISFDKSRNTIVYRQFNNEGYINRYILVDSLSTDSTLVFETEEIENFVPGGKARWTIRKISENEIETIFDVSLPQRGYTCFGTNRLHRKE